MDTRGSSRPAASGSVSLKSRIFYSRTLGFAVKAVSKFGKVFQQQDKAAGIFTS